MGPNFSGIRGLILVLMSNLLLGRNCDCFGDYLVVTPRYLVITARCQVVTGGYCSLPIVTARPHI